MELSINYKAFSYKLSGIIGLFLIASLIGLLLSMSIPVIYKLGFVLLPVVVIVIFLTVNPLWILSLFLLFRPELEMFKEAGLLKIFAGLMIVFAFFILTTRRERVNLCWDRLKYLYVFTSVSIISLVYTIDYKNSIVFILKVFSFIAIYLLAFNLIKSKRDGIRLLSYFPLAAILPLVYGFYQFFSGNIYLAKETGLERASSFFVLANQYSHFLFIMFFASLPLVLQNYNEKKKKYSLSILLFAMIATICILAVRSTWIVFLFGILIIGYFLPVIRKYIKIFVPVVLLMFMPIFVKGFGSVINPPRVYGKYKNTIYTRFAIWNQLIPVVKKKPFWGSGVGTAEKVAHENFTLIPHNDYLRVLLDTGIAGFIPYVLFLISNITSSYKDIALYKENRYLNVCTFAFFVAFVILTSVTNTFYYTVLVWYAMSYLAITYKLNYLTSQNISL